MPVYVGVQWELRRECFDHLIVLNQRHAKRLLHEFLDFYNQDRVHLALGKDAPDHRATEPPHLGNVEPDIDRIGRITPLGVVTEVGAGITAGAGPVGITAGPDGNLWFTEVNGNRIGRITVGSVMAKPMAVDVRVAPGSISNHNGVLETGETVQVAPAWTNLLTGSQSFTVHLTPRAPKG